MKLNHSPAKPHKLAVALAVAMFSVASQAAGITLKEAAQEAVSKNPEVLARWDAYKAATEEIDVAKGNYLPQLDLTAAVGREHRKTPGIINDSYTRNNVSLLLDQMLFDGFATRNEVAKYSYAQRVRYNELLDASENTALEAMRAYTDVQRYRKLYQLAQENYVQHRVVFDQIQQRVQSGVGRGVDLEQAAGRLALAESNLLTEASNLHDVSARYQRVVGSLPPEEMADLPSLDAGIPTGADLALRAAYAQHPALQAAQENIVAAQSDAKIRHAAFMPRVDLRARQDLGHNLDGYQGRHELSYIELLLNYNLYNGGSDKAAERQYWEQVNVAKDERDKVCRDVRQTLNIAYNDVKRLKEQLGYLEQHQLSTEKARDAYHKQFDIGQRTLLDLLDTENELFEAKRAYQNAYYDHLYSMGRTHAGMGDLLQVMGLQHLDTPKLADADEKAAFDPDTICPPEAPKQNSIDKDKVFAEAMASAPVVVPLVPAGSGAAGGKMAAAGEADQDADGVVDAKDQCPNTPKGTKVDEKGCPYKAIIELKGVNFDYDKAVVRKDSMPALDEGVALMKAHPEIKVEVAGHTDSDGSEAYNLSLSTRRTEAVVAYMVSKGIAKDRLAAKGYGESQPVADNGTPEGKAKNRRVEMRILNQ
ncbi:TolC family outer membrane protein [Parasulfuritortus cantonensis]|uniref:TolC family outer membrane protein n=1 Tax=Parasulfuritortus cantonensis TaxID=2528202 RepID=UPI0014053B7F|nr:TolC family outer membrane protein [Parasulfuritortus cantonensis]